MIIGTQTDIAVQENGLDAALDMIAAAGFKALDFTMFDWDDNGEPWTLSGSDFDNFFVDISNKIKSHGLTVNQTHSPFPTFREEDSDEVNARRLRLQELSVRATALLGSRLMIFHPGSVAASCYGQNREADKARNMERYLDVWPLLQKYDVYCCIENMWKHDAQRGTIAPCVCTTAEEMCDYIDTLNAKTGSDRYAACLDIGHGNLIHNSGFDTVEPAKMIRILGKRLRALHVHDNFGAADEHVLPGMGNIDWPSVRGALYEVGYPGVFSLEADNTLRRFPAKIRPRVYEFMYEVADAIIN